MLDFLLGEVVGKLFKWYLDALFDGNPFVIGVTAIVVIAVSAGPFSKGLSTGDPAAIGMAAGILVLIVIVLAVGVIDRRNDPDRKKRKKGKKRPSAPAGRR